MYERDTAATVFLGFRFWIEFNTYRMLEKRIIFTTLVLHALEG